jgi:hypothetical protein
MEENSPPPRRSSQTAFDIHHGLKWGRAIVASLIAIVVFTITMGIFGVNTIKDLGNIILLGTKLMGSDAGLTTQYLVGGVLYVLIGIIYGVIYCGIISPLGANHILKGVLYGTVLSAIAIIGLPGLTNLATNNTDVLPAEVSFSDVPLSEETPASPDTTLTESMAEAASSLETTAIEDTSAAADDGIVKTNIISWINHVIYALVVALVYRRKGILNT